MPPSRTRIASTSRRDREPWLARYGGLISSEWEFAKGLQLLEEVRRSMTDGSLRGGCGLDRVAAVRGVCSNACTAGYKGIYRTAPTRADFLAALNPAFSGFVTESSTNRSPARVTVPVT